MMPRYIDADWLLERAVPMGWSTPKWVTDIAIRDAPTIDAVEVVRCKDCKWFKDGCLNSDMPICGDDATSFNPDKNFFCAYGKRREKQDG